MACSGINEHKEGCRKQRVLDRAAYARKLLMEGHQAQPAVAQQRVEEDPEAPGYMRKMGSPPGIPRDLGSDSYSRQVSASQRIDLAGCHSPTAVDRLRREQVRAQQLCAYSAKLPDRLSSVNYTQQW